MNQYLQENFNIKNVVLAAVAVLLMAAMFYLCGFSLVMPLLLLLAGIQLFFFKKATVRLFLNMGLLLTLLMVAAHLFQAYSSISNLYIPVSCVTMLTMLLYNDLQLSFIMAFLASVLTALTIGGDLGYMLIFFLGGVSGGYVVQDARTRGQLINAGIVVGVVQAVSAVLLHTVMTHDVVMLVLKPLFLNGLLAAGVVIFTLKVFEFLFGELTNFTLLELSDATNQPLLKRMILEAPGTYHHTLIVSNLAEAAADAVGAHALLARVGAYYHDIGKMIKPEYFTENQMMTGNKHDDLEPSMSRLVILNHVREGIELAKKHRLNQKIVDFIPQHHGTALIYYFYQRALEESDGQVVQEENYRYPGPKPQTRETAIVLLADSVEGATRSMDEHTPVKIEEVVRKVVNNKFIDGQLDECPLTLKDIDVICATFSRVLSAMYHGRVKYPEKKTNGNHGKKPADESPRSSDADPSDHPQNP